MSTLGRAIAIAAQAHQDQRDRAEQPYILHPLRMMLRQTNDAARIVAVLHDVVEDTTWTLALLRTEGFGEEIIAALDAVTRRDDETYTEFVERSAANVIARQVKLADLEDNMDIRRLQELDAKSLERLQKYHAAWLRLQRTP